MLLAADIGNTQTALGLFEGEALVHSWKWTTRASDTADEIFAALCAQLQLLGVEVAAVDDVILASVVPSLTGAWREAAEHLCGLAPVVVGPGVKTSLPMRYDNPAEVGADRVADAVAALAEFGAPVVVVDLGTATNIEVIDEDGAFRGGIIAPGLATSASALFSRAARIPQSDLAAPKSVIGTNTADAVRSGLVCGEAAKVDGLVHHIFRELGYEAPVVATGGFAQMIGELSRVITHVDQALTLKGLRLIYAKNRR